MSDRPSVRALIRLQVRYQNRLFWRSPISALFTLAFPLLFLVLFNLLFDGVIEFEGRESLTVAQFYAPALAAFAAASATYTNIGVRQAIARDQRILKRIRSTPLPPWVYMAGVIGSAIWIAFLATLLMLSVGVIFYGLQIEVGRLPGVLLTFVVGVASFAALGLALAAFAPSGESAPAVANATILPIAFVSDVFIPIQGAAAWLGYLGDVFPLKHFVHPLQDAFNPSFDGSVIDPVHLVVMALWGVAGMMYALRYFSWEPKTTDTMRLRFARFRRSRTS